MMTMMKEELEMHAYGSLTGTAHVHIESVATDGMHS